MEERKLYRYRYVVESEFEPAICQHFFKVRAVPCQNAAQRLVEQRLTILPTDSRWRASTDGFGNVVHYGSCCAVHDRWQMVSEGVAECRPYGLVESEPSAIYFFPTRLTRWDDALRHWAEWHASRCKLQPLPAERQSTLMLQLVRKRRVKSLLAEGLMHAVHRYLRYQRSVTDNATSALDVFRLKCGVCQDYAHLMIAACRSIGLRARYVNGLVVGEGETHAWVEVYDGWQWRGFDPTRDCVICFGYLKLAHGRDVSDCPSNRGQIFGLTTEHQHVSVVMEEIGMRN